MGPIREFKRRKKAEKRVDHNHNAFAVALSSLPLELDWWDHFSTRLTGPLSNSRKPNTFESIFKISRKTFDYICSIVNDTLKTKSNLAGSNKRPLSPTDQVAIALRRLSCGESLLNVGDLFGVNQSTVSQITWRFVEAMEERGLHHLRWPSTEAEMEDIKTKFEKMEGLPNCCGVIDTTHILMTLSSVDDSNDAWIDREKNHSMVLQAIIGPDMRFLDVTIGYPGSLSDALVLQNSEFSKLAEERERLNGKKIELEKGTKVREYIIGDEGFPLLPWLITPFQQALHDYQVEFNKRHSATQMVAQTALARLKEMWRIVHGTAWLPDKNKLPRIAFVCCLLHNIVIEMEDKVLDEMPLSHEHDKDYRQQICESASPEGTDLREELSLHLSGELVNKNNNPNGQAPKEVQPTPSTSGPIHPWQNDSSIEMVQVDVDASQPSQLVTLASEKRKQMDSLVTSDPFLIANEAGSPSPPNVGLKELFEMKAPGASCRDAIFQSLFKECFPLPADEEKYKKESTTILSTILFQDMTSAMSRCSELLQRLCKDTCFEVRLKVKEDEVTNLEKKLAITNNKVTETELRLNTSQRKMAELERQLADSQQQLANSQQQLADAEHAAKVAYDAAKNITDKLADCGYLYGERVLAACQAIHGDISNELVFDVDFPSYDDLKEYKAAKARMEEEEQVEWEQHQTVEEGHEQEKTKDAAADGSSVES